MSRDETDFPAPLASDAQAPTSDYSPRGAGAVRTPAPRYLTLAAARAIECNGCGDCCDSRRSDGFWTWGNLPQTQHRELHAGASLIIPLERIDGSWRDRAWTADDAKASQPTRFRCAAFVPGSDSGGSCALHDATRPDRCGEFPVAGPEIEPTLAAEGEVWLQTASFPRCSWFRICIVADDDSRRTRP